MAFSFEPFLAISAGHFMAVSAGPEQHDTEGAYLCSYNDSYPPILLGEEDVVHLYGAIVEVINPD